MIALVPMEIVPRKADHARRSPGSRRSTCDPLTAVPYFWVPFGCETGTPSGKPGPNAPPVSTHQGDTGWLFVKSSGVRLSLLETV